MRILPVLYFLFPLLSGGCFAGRIPLSELQPGKELEINLDANARVVVPMRRVKFYVDIINHGRRTIDLSSLDIELTASPRGRPDVIRLRKAWQYRWATEMILGPGKKITMPIVPEIQRHKIPSSLGHNAAVAVSEFPLAALAAGEYEIRASVGAPIGARFQSSPYSLRVQRPDL